MNTHVLPAAVLAVLMGAQAAQAADKLGAADQAAAFKAAGFKQAGKQWRSCEDSAPSYQPGAIAEVRDLNGDGRPEAVITEGSTNCYGSTETGYSLVSKQADGGWKLITQGTGVLSVLAGKGAGGWPDLEIGGPGFCFPVVRWDGKEYKLLRHQYEGKACRPAR
jgi:hypothetical protein